jgi:ubiquinone/menaquinone biosynthesis C-methylase UbiE
MGPGAVFGDLACGRGGPGLWLARATSASLIGVDWSEVAIAEATARAGEFVSADRAQFVVGYLDASGLVDQSLHGAVCIDALFFAPDRIAALREVGRVLRPGGRFLFTAHETVEPTRPADVLDWSDLVQAADLEVVSKEMIPGCVERTQRLYHLWLEHLDELRRELGDVVAGQLATEATTVGPTLASRRPLLVTARRPANSE